MVCLARRASIVKGYRKLTDSISASPKPWLLVSSKSSFGILALHLAPGSELSLPITPLSKHIGVEHKGTPSDDVSLNGDVF